MQPGRTSHPTVTIPPGCHDEVVPTSDRRAQPLVDAGVAQVALSSVVAGFDWPGPDPHTHLVLVTVDGSGWLETGSDRYRLDVGRVAVCPAHQARRHHATEPWRVVTIRLGEHDRWAGLEQRQPFVLDGVDPRRFSAPVLGMLAESSPAVTDVSGAARGRAPLDEFVRRYAATMRQGPGPDAAAVPSEPFSLHAAILVAQLSTLSAVAPEPDVDVRRLQGLWEQVRRRPDSDWSGDRLAAYLSVSRATLHRMTTRCHGEPPGAIVERIRMDHAERLLAYGDLPVGAVAAQVGYSTPYSFSAAFRRSHGCSLSAFRTRVVDDGLSAAWIETSSISPREAANLSEKARGGDDGGQRD